MVQRPGEVYQCAPGLGGKRAGVGRGQSWVTPCPSVLVPCGHDIPRPLISVPFPKLPHPSGLCVATPVRVRVFRKFHLHLRLPISVHRFEQLELRPVLYNYLDKDVTVRTLRSTQGGGS